MGTIFRQEFIDALEDFISDAFSDYACGEPTYELTDDNLDYPNEREALIKFKTSDGQEWTVPVGVDGDGEIGIHIYEDHYLPLDRESLHAHLWQEAAQKVRGLKAKTEAFANYVFSCRLNNTRDWMEGLADELNEVAKALKDTAVIEFKGDSLRIIKEKVNG